MEEAGFYWVKTLNERAQTYRQAFNLFPTKWGSFTGEAVSGYSSKVGVQFFFGEPTRGWWCGDTGKPLADGQRVQGYEGRFHVD